ncbi:hypothetical protein CcaverHIS002_0505190 [Cutaneotrichosporon cavernicola]|nr:hypothetical protein CcaverHIS002_0505190 [Cutaneotrichosporon cavernicola]BEJ08486.1 hypothetical protein CcaverHIS641_0505800 [Cutaneotrichosporon cavernicola]
MVANGEPSNLTAFPLPPATPLPSTYPCQLGSQHERNNFRPREFKRIPSAAESQAALRRTLQKYWGHSDFRGPQLDICLHALRGCDVLVVAPTGLGKSVCFQVPAVTIEYGITIVVSPLLALMRDQVSSMRLKGIQAFQLSEKTDPADVQEIKRQLRLGHPQLRLLYVTPETLFSPKYTSDFDIAYRQKQIVRLVVDEAHVIDEWGSTFRPTYRKLGEFRLRYPGVPITALTASATSDVRSDLLTILNMPKTSDQGLAQWVEPFNRKNLFYEVRHMSGWDRQGDTIDDLTKFIRSFSREAEGINTRHNLNAQSISGLVYCRSVTNGTTKRQDAQGEMDTCPAASFTTVRYTKSLTLTPAREDAKYLRGLITKEAESARKNGLGHATLERAKLRMLNSFKALQHYAESISQCRHIAIGRFFGEDIKEVTQQVKQKYCDGMCDVCSNRAGVYHRAMALNEDCEVASPVIQPPPLESSPRYLAQSGHPGNSLAMFHASSSLAPTSRAMNLSPIQDISSAEDPDFDDDFTKQWLAENDRPTPLRTPASRSSFQARNPLATPVPSRFATVSPGVGASAFPRALFTTPQTQVLRAHRLQTMDQVVDEGVTGAVVVLGDEPTPEYAQQKRKARDDAFKGVTPAREGGPLSFYNGGVPRKRTKAASDFKTPFLDPSAPMPPLPPPARRAQEALFLPGPSQFSQLDESDNTAPPAPVREASRGTVPDGAGRQAAIQKLREALRLSFESGALAEEVLKHWGRTEVGDRRLQLLKKVARELELDIAKMGRQEEPYNDIVDETCAALKLVRDTRGVRLVTSGRLVATQDTRVERLRHVEQCMRSVKVR